jgi:nucleoside-diphosphate-sugar epimerase
LHVEDLGRAVLACVTHRDRCTGATFEPDDEQAGGHGWADIIACARGAMPVLELCVPRALLNVIARINLVLSRVFRYAPMLTPGKVRELSEPSWLCDNSRLRAVTGWVPEVPLRTGIARLFGQ